MHVNEVKNIYGKNGPEAALEAYKAFLAEHPESGDELAFIAADYAHPEALALLFGAGVSPDITDKYQHTLLHYLGKQPESTYYIKPEGAVRATTELLLDNKLSALRKDTNRNMTCYHYAAENGMAEMIEALAARGAKLNMTDKDGNTGIHIACDYVRHALKNVEFSKNSAERAKKNYEETLAGYKSQGRTEEQIAQYVSSNASAPEKAQQEYDAAVARVERYFRVVKAFAEGGVDKDEKNGYGQSALDIAVKSDAKKIAAYLSGTLTDDADGSAIAAGGMTLHQAAEKGDKEAIKAIAAAGADLNGLKEGERHRNGGCTPLAIAVIFMKNEAAEALLACGADPSFKDSSGRVAVSYLNEASVNGPAFEEKRIPRFIKDMVSVGLNINTPVDDDGNTLLILACKSGRSGGYNKYTKKGEMISGTLKHNPDINLKNRFGETALMHACARDFEIMEQVQLTLLEQGANVAAADKNGDTALHYAARNGDRNGAKTLCDMLLEFGAVANVVNNAGQTALDIATENENEPLVKLLLGKM